MQIESINASQQTFSSKKKQIAFGNNETTKQKSGSSKDIITTLGILASLGIATAAIVKNHNNAKNIADESKKLADNLKKLNEAVDTINENIKKNTQNAKKTTKKKTKEVIDSNANTEQVFATKQGQAIELLTKDNASPEKKLIAEWESYTPERLAKSPALRERKKEIKKQLLGRGYTYNRTAGQFEAPVAGSAPINSQNTSNTLNYNLQKVCMLNEYLKSLPKTQYGSLTMDSNAKDYIVKNILKKEFNLKSKDVDELREQCRTLSKFIRVINGKIVGSGTPKNDLINEISSFRQKLTERIDELKK